MINVNEYFDNLPEIPYKIGQFIEYMRDEHPEKENLYDVIIFISLFHYNDKDLAWIRKSSENMNNFLLAWIMNKWITVF